MKLNKIIIILIFLLFSVISCVELSKKELEELPGEKFYFQKFYYHQTGTNCKRVFNIMKLFPMDNIMKIVEHKYGISIETSKFDNFISANDPSKIKSEDLILIATDYTWESDSKKPNGIEFELYFQKRMDIGKEYNEYKIYLIMDDKKRVIGYGGFFNPELVLPTVAGDLGYERLKKDNGDIYKNKKNKSQINLSTEISGPVKDEKENDK